MNKGFEDKLNEIIGGCLIEESTMSDLLVTVLCTYFEKHIDRPVDDPQDDEEGWGKWAIAKTDNAIKFIAEDVANAISTLPMVIELENENKKLREGNLSKRRKEVRPEYTQEGIFNYIKETRKMLDAGAFEDCIETIWILEWMKLRIENIEATLKTNDFVIGKFKNWYSSEGCPYSENSFCPDFDKLKAEHETEMLKIPEIDRYAFDPQDDCGVGEHGFCFAAYYEKLWQDKQDAESEASNGCK